MKYEYLITPRMRKEVLEIGDALAKYMHDNEIPNIMLMDRSARPAYMTLKNSWKKNYHGEKCPNIYFTNPMGYDMDDKPLSRLSREFNKTYTRLAENKDAPIMLFDVCMHEGDTLKPVIQTMRKAGYSNLIIGLAQPVSNHVHPIPIDFIAINHKLGGQCYPFRRDDMVEQHYENLISRPDPSTEWGRSIRKEMKSVFRGNVESNYY